MQYNIIYGRNAACQWRKCEICPLHASGGLRSEVGAVRRIDCNHLSDSQNPMDVLRI